MKFDPADLAAFPSYTLPGGMRIHRIHGDHRHVWNFRRADDVRFAPTAASDAVGACYLSAVPLGAFVEVFRSPKKPITSAAITRLALSNLKVGRSLRLADLISRKSLPFDTASIDSEHDYTDAQGFASAAADAGFDGIRYYARHDPAKKLVSFAVFGPDGSPDPADPLWLAGDKEPLPDSLIDEAVEEFDYTIAPSP